jgi:hypothetical protein
MHRIAVARVRVDSADKCAQTAQTNLIGIYTAEGADVTVRRGFKTVAKLNTDKESCGVLPRTSPDTNPSESPSCFEWHMHTVCHQKQLRYKGERIPNKFFRSHDVWTWPKQN